MFIFGKNFDIGKIFVLIVGLIIISFSKTPCGSIAVCIRVHGWMGKYIRVNLTQGVYDVKDIDEAWRPETKLPLMCDVC